MWLRPIDSLWHFIMGCRLAPSRFFLVSLCGTVLPLLICKVVGFSGFVKGSIVQRTQKECMRLFVCSPRAYVHKRHAPILPRRSQCARKETRPQWEESNAGTMGKTLGRRSIVARCFSESCCPTATWHCGRQASGS